MSETYVVEFKNWKTNNWVKVKEYKNKYEIVKDFGITLPTIRNIIKNGNGIYSKFLKISVK